MEEILLIALFGAAGCVLRYGLTGLVYDITGTFFPYGTLGVNALGSFVLGTLMEAGTSFALVSSEIRTAIAIGLLGGFTTFSTFSYETVKLLEEGSLVSAGFNIAANVVVCLLAVYGGIIIGRVIS